jgi:probable HAF family extracellular repeat protein
MESNTMVGRRGYVLGVIALASALALPLHAQVSHYTITNASQAVPGHSVGMVGLSDTGFVAGWVIGAESPFASKSFRWSSGGTVVPEPPAGVAWLTHAAIDVNDGGIFVGYFGSQGPNLLNRGFRTAAGVTKELLTPSGLYAFPSAINDAGWIVGYGGGPVGVPGAVIWSPDLVPGYVGTLSQAVDINDRNEVVGTKVDLADVTTAFRVVDGKMTRLGTLDPQNKGSVQPFAINNAGTVVGYSIVGSGKRAFRWTEAGGMTELPGLGFSGSQVDVVALDINDAGEIIGYAPGPSGQTSVIWSLDGSVNALAKLIPDIGVEKDWLSLALVMKINSAGQIVALAAHKPSNYQARIALLTPAVLGARLKAGPGGVTLLDVVGATPGKPVFLAAGADDPFDRGYTLLPGCGPIGLAMDGPYPIAVAEADATGRALFHWNLPAPLSGVDVRLQAFQLASCAVSNVVRLPQ